jgi:hypothetical protein
MGTGRITPTLISTAAILTALISAIRHPISRPVVTLLGVGVGLGRVSRYPFIGLFRFLVTAIRLTGTLLRGRLTARISIGDWKVRGAKGPTTYTIMPAGNNSRMTTHTSPALSANSA